MGNYLRAMERHAPAIWDHRVTSHPTQVNAPLQIGRYTRFIYSTVMEGTTP